MGATAGANRLTWDDLLAFGVDGARREIIDGELFVSPAASWRHQRVVARLCALLLGWADAHGGEVAAGPNTYFAHTDVVEPDVVLAGPDRPDQIVGLRFMGPPDLVVEVSSPSTRRWDLVRKRGLYERHGVRSTGSSTSRPTVSMSTACGTGATVSRDATDGARPSRRRDCPA